MWILFFCLLTFVSNVFGQLLSTRRTFIHITDIHYDPFYEPFTDEATMCHHGSGKAGRFGTEGAICDSPQLLIQQAFSRIVGLEPDFLIYTGDSTRHDRDMDLPRSDNDLVSQLSFVSGKFENLFFVHNIPVYPAIGNWDVFPKDMLANNDTYSLELIWTQWGKFLSKYDTVKETFLQGGYYKIDSVSDTMTNLGVISINTLFWFSSNERVEDCSTDLEFIDSKGNYNSGDKVSFNPDRQLLWLNYVLKNSDINRKYFIIGHIPPITIENIGLYKPNCLKHFINILGLNAEKVSTAYYGHVNIDAAYFVYRPKPLVSGVTSLELDDSQFNVQLLENFNERNVFNISDISSNYNITAVTSNFLSDTNSDIFRTLYSRKLMNPRVVLNTSPSLTPVHAPSFRIGKISINNNVQDQYQLYANLKAATMSNVDFIRGCGSRKHLGIHAISPNGWRGLLRKLRNKTTNKFWSRYNDCLTIEDAANHTDRLYLSKRTVSSILVITTGIFIFLIAGIHIVSARRSVLESDVYREQRKVFDTKRIPRAYGGGIRS